jgi:hypothetical protein
MERSKGGGGRLIGFCAFLGWHRYDAPSHRKEVDIIVGAPAQCPIKALFERQLPLGLLFPTRKELCYDAKSRGQPQRLLVCGGIPRAFLEYLRLVLSSLTHPSAEQARPPRSPCSSPWWTIDLSLASATPKLPTGVGQQPPSRGRIVVSAHQSRVRLFEHFHVRIERRPASD